MSTLTIINHPFGDEAGPGLSEKIEIDNLLATLTRRYAVFPSGGRLYFGAVARSCDMTPTSGDLESIRHLASLEGDFFLVIYPEGSVVAAVVGIVLAVTAVASYFMRPSMPTSVVAQQRNNVATSPNNSLSARSNDARPNGRIPDIFGRIRSTPDLISVPILQFVDNVEVEDAVMCVGRGQYEIHDARDGQTPINEIDGASIQVYKPNTAINSGTPYYQIGTLITEPARKAVRINSVNGQELPAPNSASFNAGRSTFSFKSPNMVTLVSSQEHSGLDAVFKPNSGLKIDYPNFLDNFTTGGEKSYTLNVTPVWLNYSPYTMHIFIPYVNEAKTQELATAKTFEVTEYPWPANGLMRRYLAKENKVRGVTGGSDAQGNRYDVVVLDLSAPASEVWADPAAVAATFKTTSDEGVKTYTDSIIPIWRGLAASLQYFIHVFIPYKDAAQTAELREVKTFQVTNQPWGDMGFLATLMGRRATVIDYAEGNDGQGKRYDVLILSTQSATILWNQPAAVSADIVVAQGLCHLDGEYSTLGVGVTQLSLSNPAEVQSGWNTLATFPNQQSDALSNVTLTAVPSDVGWFVLGLKDRTEIWCNFVAMNGLYKDNGQTQRAVNVDIQVTIQQIDDNDNPMGTERTYTTTVYGSASSKSTKATTFKVTTPFVGRCRIKCQRLTKTDLEYEGTVMDEVKWRDLYAIAPLKTDNFGDVTIVRSRTYGTEGALAVKERRLNMLVTRQIPLRVSGSTFTSDLRSTRDAADIFSFICLDPKIGNRAKDEVDFDSIHDTIAEVKAYFGTPAAGEFNYTLDNDNLTFEETASMVAEAVFCRAYRRGSLIRLFFEKETDRSALLFNHRNKIPGTETRSITFGYQNENDGVEYEYISPEDDSAATIYVPADRSAQNPMKHKSVGVRSKVQAHLHALRLYNRLLFQNTAVEFEATDESNLLLLGDRVIVADNTVPNTQDGDIVGQNGLTLRTSQKVAVSAGDQIFLQYSDGSVESISVNPGPDDRSVTLAYAPRLPLVTDPAAYTQTKYVISSPQQTESLPFLVGSIDVQADFRTSMQLINYDHRYYGNDKDYINGLIAE